MVKHLHYKYKKCGCRSTRNRTHHAYGAELSISDLFAEAGGEDG